jgi:hypothetical protein
MLTYSGWQKLLPIESVHICHSERREATVLVVKDKVSQIARVVGA